MKKIIKRIIELFFLYIILVSCQTKQLEELRGTNQALSLQLSVQAVISSTQLPHTSTISPTQQMTPSITPIPLVDWDQVSIRNFGDHLRVKGDVINSEIVNSGGVQRYLLFFSSDPEAVVVECFGINCRFLDKTCIIFTGYVNPCENRLCIIGHEWEHCP